MAGLKRKKKAKTGICAGDASLYGAETGYVI